MSKSYVSNMSTNKKQPFTKDFVIEIMMLIVPYVLVDIAIYLIFSNGAQSFWTKPVLGVLVVVQVFIIACFWKKNRS